MGIFRQGISEETVDRNSVHAKPTKAEQVYSAHTKVTGTDIPTNKFALDVLPYYDPANPPPVKRSDIPTIRNFTTDATPGTELVLVLPINLQQINIRNTSASATIYFATAAAGAQFSIPQDASLTWDNLNLTAARNIWVSSDEASITLEIWEWV